MRRICIALPAIVLGLTLACVTGCARSAEERQLDEMREALTNVDENQAFGEKLTAKELGEIVKQRGSAKTPMALPSRQRTVRWEDGSEEEADVGTEVAGADAADDPSARPVLKVKGIPHARGGDVVEETMPDENASTQPQSTQPRPSALDPEAKRAYDAALALVNDKKYGPALDAFAGFLMKYPDHPYAANAMYWRGECYFAQGEYVRAIEQFDGVVARFPLGGKTPDALLKLGISQQKLGNPTKAKEYFDKLGREWPRSDAVRHIPEKP
jgi:tol-pal system protein YbgF